MINNQRFHPEAICDESHINFMDLLEKQWSINSRSESEFTNFQPKIFEDIKPDTYSDGAKSVMSLMESHHTLGLGTFGKKK